MWLDLCSDASGNRLELIPATVGDLPALQMLDLSHNMLNSLPTTIGGLSTLWTLWASHNHLEWIPATIGDLKVHSLDVSHNRLKSLPDTIGGLCNIDASFNAITAFPAVWSESDLSSCDEASGGLTL